MSDDRPKRRRLRMSVGMMMLIILAFGLWMGRLTGRARAQRDLIDAVKKHGGWVHFDYEYVNGKLTPGRRPWAPEWMRRAIGDEYFRNVRQISLVYDDSTGRRFDNANSEPCDDVLALLDGQSGLKEILLQGRQATDRGLASLGSLTSLEDLYIWDSTQISDKGVMNLANLINMKNLHLEKSKLTDAGLQSLSRMTDLEQLALEGHSFSDEGLASVEGMKHLRGLYVTGSSRLRSRITDRGLERIAALSDLEHIGLGYSEISDRGLKFLTGMKKLKFVDLSGCRITDEGLDELSKLDKLESILLPDTEVTGEGLEKLKGLKNLKFLSLPRGVSDESKRLFRGAMPRTPTVW